MNIVETVQKNLGFDPLRKIDPNTQETSGDDISMGNTALAQAAIPSILLGIFNKLEDEPEASWLNTNTENSGLFEKIFGKAAPVVAGQISKYSKSLDKNSDQELEHIAAESIRVVGENIRDISDRNSVRKYVADHKPDTLLYLPPALQLGRILNNNNLDDRTGKMEGPVSSFMHTIEKTFNSSQGN
jgi:hypothetical protein